MHNERDAGEVVLLPCPFCRGTATIYASNGVPHGNMHAGGTRHVECDDCFAQGPAEPASDLGTAWNTRPPAPEDAGTVERVARVLCDKHIRRARRWDTDPAELEAKMPAAIDYNWRDYEEDAAAVVAALSRLDGEKGADMVLVPRAPTQEMLQAAKVAPHSMGEHNLCRVWNAMLDAASKGEK